MTADFDPYLQWLGIRDPQRPPNAYRLLGIEIFESDPEVIHTAADRQMAHLRTFQHGAHADQSQQLLNEVAAARVLLVDPQQKSTYDQSLQAETVDLAAVEERSADLLNPPGRGRGERPWYYPVALLVPLLLVAALAVGYRAARVRYVAMRSQQLRQTVDEEPADATLAPQAPSDSQPTESDADSAPQDTEPQRQQVQPPTDREQPGVSEDDASDSRETQENTTSGESGEKADTPDDAAAVEPQVAKPTWIERSTDAKLRRWDDLPPWRPDAPSFDAERPMGHILMSLSQRNSAAAHKWIVNVRTSPSLAIQPMQIADAELVLTAVQTFWMGVQHANEQLKIGDQLDYRGMAVSVRSLEPESIELTSPSGESRAYSREIHEMDLPLAVALAQRYWSPSGPVAWRLAATVLALDREGNGQRASDYAWRAEQAGLSSDYLTRALRRLQDLPELPVPPVMPTDLQPLDDAGPSTPEQASGPPDREAQRTARREVLSPLLRELREADVPRDQQPLKILEKAEAPDVSRPAKYVMLKTVVSRATISRDLDTAWAAIDHLENEFAEDGSQLRHRTLQRIARREKGEGKRRYAQRAAELARAAILRDNYDSASQFATLAIEIARNVADQSFSQSLLRLKKDVLATKDAFQALSEARDLLKRNPGDPWALADVAEFEVLTKGNFTDLGSYRDTAGDDLKPLVQAELSVGRLPSHQSEVGEQWYQFAQSLEGVQRSHALRRARFWLELAVDELPEQQVGAVREMLSAITQSIGRPSDRVDLTKQVPVSATVGFGSLGINRNPDAGTGRTKPLPDLEGRKITRFFWACAPSSLRFAIPADARRFEAQALLNAASQDGVQFAVLVDGDPVFQSPVVRTVGVPIDVTAEIPTSAKQLELRIEAGNNRVNDHAYWIAPVIIVHPSRAK